MRLYTIQLSQWRLAKELDIPLLDTTVKSGVAAGNGLFTPTWEIVTGVKSGEITEAEYTEQYLILMRESYLNNRQRWLDVCQMPVVAIACYCPPGTFCHRHLLADCFERVCLRQGIAFTHEGELTRSVAQR